MQRGAAPATHDAALQRGAPHVRAPTCRTRAARGHPRGPSGCGRAAGRTRRAGGCRGCPARRGWPGPGQRRRRRRRGPGRGDGHAARRDPPPRRRRDPHGAGRTRGHGCGLRGPGPGQRPDRLGPHAFPAAGPPAPGHDRDPPLLPPVRVRLRPADTEVAAADHHPAPGPRHRRAACDSGGPAGAPAPPGHGPGARGPPAPPQPRVLAVAAGPRRHAAVGGPPRPPNPRSGTTAASPTCLPCSTT